MHVTYAHTNRVHPREGGQIHKQKLSSQYDYAPPPVPYGLVAFTVVTGLAHFAQGVAILALRRNVSVPTYIMINLWPRHGDEVQVFAPLRYATGGISVELSIAAFFFLSAAFQIGAVLDVRRFANDVLMRGVQPLRFVEYAVSASLMTLVISVLFGIQSADFLVILFVAMASVMLLGIIQERQLAKLRIAVEFYKQSSISSFDYFAPHAVGWLLFLGIVSIFSLRFVLTVNQSSLVNGSKPPAWVYTIIVLEMIVFGSFGINQLAQQARFYRLTVTQYGTAQYAKRFMSAALTAEYVYVALSLTAKSFLCWVLYINMLAVDSIQYS